MGKILFGNKVIEFDDEYSSRDFTGKKLSTAKLNGKTIYGSCFSQEIPDTKIFPSDMKDVSFYGCNLDNVFIPAGNTVIGGTQRKFKVMNDLMDWAVDKDMKPVEPIMIKEFIKLGISIDPKDIPETKMVEDIITNQVKE